MNIFYYLGLAMTSLQPVASEFRDTMQSHPLALLSYVNALLYLSFQMFFKTYEKCN